MKLAADVNCVRIARAGEAEDSDVGKKVDR